MSPCHGPSCARQAAPGPRTEGAACGHGLARAAPARAGEDAAGRGCVWQRGAVGLFRRLREATAEEEGGVRLDAPDADPTRDVLLSAGAMDIASRVAPEVFLVDRGHVQVGDEFCRTLFVSALPPSGYDGWLWPLFRFQEPMSVTMHITPLDSQRVIDRLKSTLARDAAQMSKTEDEGMITNFGVARRYEDNEAMLNMLQNDMTRLFQLSLLVTLRAKSLAELDRITESLERRMTMAETRRATLRHEAGFLSTLPVMRNDLADLFSVRTLHTQGLQTIFPFNSSDIAHETGALFGINMSTNSNVIINRFRQPAAGITGNTVANPGMAIFGSSGSGKSQTAKMEMLQWTCLGVPVIVIDPQNEYDRLCEALGGQFISIAVDSDEKINPLDFSHAVSARGNPLARKLQMVTELIQVMLRAGRQDTPPLTDYQRSILDNALRLLYERFGYSVRDVVGQRQATPDTMPILSDLLDRLIQLQRVNGRDPRYDDQIRPLIMGLQRYCGDGSLSGLFDHPTSVDLASHFTVFNISQLSDELLPIGMHLILEFLRSSLFTYEQMTGGQVRLLYVDEAQKLMAFPETALFLQFVSRTARKFGVGFTVMTQDPQVFLINADGTDNATGIGVLQNLATTVLLRQHKNALDSIQQTFGLTDAEIAYLASSKTGEGLVFVDEDRAWVSMVNMASPLETELMTTSIADVAQIHQRKRAQLADQIEQATSAPHRSHRPVRQLPSGQRP